MVNIYKSKIALFALVSALSTNTVMSSQPGAENFCTSTSVGIQHDIQSPLIPQMPEKPESSSFIPKALKEDSGAVQEIVIAMTDLIPAANALASARADQDSVVQESDSVKPETPLHTTQTAADQAKFPFQPSGELDQEFVGLCVTPAACNQ